MTLLQFRLNIAECLIKHNTNPLDKATEGKPRRSLQNAPPADIRFDGVGHFPVWKDKRQRCKFSGCAECFSYVFCEKCEVSLFEQTKKLLSQISLCMLAYRIPVTS